MFDARKAHVEMLPNGWWVILNPDGSRFNNALYTSRAAAMRALTFEQA